MARVGGLRVTVYCRDGYGWVIADREGPHFSSGIYETEEDAMTGLAQALDLDQV